MVLMNRQVQVEDTVNGNGALAGLKVVEFAHVIAGPLAGALLADLGATIVHVEERGNGDPQRGAGPEKNGAHLWWKVAARNKRSITLNLRTNEGREVAREMAPLAGVVLHDFPVERLAEGRAGKWPANWLNGRTSSSRTSALRHWRSGASTTPRSTKSIPRSSSCR